MDIIIADRQAISAAGLMFLCDKMGYSHKSVDDKAGLIEALKDNAEATVVLDYALFDISDTAELQILGQRFPRVSWLFFSEELSADFVKTMAMGGNQYSILLKESSLAEISEALRCSRQGQRYFCRRIMDILLAPATEKADDSHLTRTETEILKDIALGYSTREIAERRCSSFHTVNTHRKNIFRKLGVNTAHEATKYALRAGLIDSAEYYI